MPSSHLILSRPLLLLPPIPPSIRVFSNESALLMRWPKYWGFSFRIIPSKEILSSRETQHSSQCWGATSIVLGARVCLVAQSRPTLCDPVESSPPGPSVHGNSPGKNTSGLPCPPPEDLPNPGIKPRSPALWVDSLLSREALEAHRVCIWLYHQ